MSQATKRCAKCKERKPATIEYFHRNKRVSDGLHSYCKVCCHISHKNRRGNIPPRPSTEDKFWRCVQKDTPTGCWQWIGAKFRSGYGAFTESVDRRWATHRFAYTILVGPIPDGMQVLHKCDNRPCVNPDHLFLGSHKENMADMVQKGRQAMGEENGQSKLREADVIEIRQLYRDGYTQKQIAERFGVAGSLISFVVRRKSWKHIP